MQGRHVSPRWLLAALFAMLAVQNLLLWRFLNFASPAAYAAGLAIIALVCGLVLKASKFATAQGPTLQRVALIGAIALLLCALGGEGRLFYANYDWQVRDAVLRDMINNPWPFVYTDRGTAEVLRAPIGMYLVPAAVGKFGGAAAAEGALLLQNGVFLTVLLALGSMLFTGTRQRVVALAVAVWFSGMDIVAWLMFRAASGDWRARIDHIELYASRDDASLQYSSHLTQLFWVPQHALAGWLCAVLFLLWKARIIRVGVFLAALPAVAIWSPLPVIGAMPFAIWASARSLVNKQIGVVDVLLPLTAAFVCIPTAAYLLAAGDSVGTEFYRPWLVHYAMLQAVEVLPFLAAVFVISLSARFRHGASTFWIVAACLIIIPFIKVGPGIDFMMRASGPAMAVLAVLSADALNDAFGDTRAKVKRAMGIALAAALAIGAVTPLLEVRRAIALRPSPRSACSMIGSADQLVGLPRTTKSTYLAPVASLPAAMRPPAADRVDTARDARPCWSRPWQTPR